MWQRGRRAQRALFTVVFGAIAGVPLHVSARSGVAEADASGRWQPRWQLQATSNRAAERDVRAARDGAWKSVGALWRVARSSHGLIFDLSTQRSDRGSRYVHAARDSHGRPVLRVFDAKDGGPPALTLRVTLPLPDAQTPNAAPLYRQNARVRVVRFSEAGKARSSALTVFGYDDARAGRGLLDLNTVAAILLDLDAGSRPTGGVPDMQHLTGAIWTLLPPR